MTAKFSVAICVYGKDKPEWFNTCLDSITKQTINPSEIVLVVDGPVSKDLHEVIDKYRDRYSDIFKVIELQENKGLGIALKTAIENSSNELVARMDSDDIAVADRFEEQLKFFEEHSDVDVVGGNISEFVGITSNVIGRRVVPSSDFGIRQYLKRRCPFNHMTVMFKKSAVLKSGNYQHWFWNEDYYLWVRMFLNNCRFANLNKDLVLVRVGKDMYARRGGVRYFLSEAKLQKFMYQNNVISFPRAFINIAQRLILQVLMPNWLRAFVFKTFARSK